MQLTNNNTVVNSAADNDVFGGIAWEEKTANDGKTTIVVAMNGVWDIMFTAVASICGAIVNIATANEVSDALGSDLLTGSVVGKSEEDANDTFGRVRVGVLA